MLPLLGAAAGLVSNLGACEAALRSALGDLTALLDDVTSASDVALLDPVTLRLLSSDVRT